MLMIVTHATLIGGKVYEAPTNTLTEILKAEKRDFFFLRHSLDGKLSSILYRYQKGSLVSEKKLVIISKWALLRYVTEILATFSYLFFVKSANRDDVYIGVDPLNAFTGLLLKKVGKIKKVVFYTADYSHKRFENKMLNFFYHTLDRFCVKNVDQVWNVSSRICSVRKEQGLSDEKNVFVPNVPSFEYKKYLPSAKKNKFCLISLGIISEQLDYIGIFDAIYELKEFYPDLLLKIIGNGPKESEYKAYVVEHKLEKHIEFLGYLDHEKALEEISHAGIGLALYNGKWSFNYFGDSMKCREYFCFGLPILTTDTHSTVEEIKESGAGIVCLMEKEDYKKAIIQIIGNYDAYSEASGKLSIKYDSIHSKLLNDLEI